MSGSSRRRKRRSKAVAATLTSLLVFSSILATNQIVYDSQNQKLHAVNLAVIEHTEALDARIYASTVVFDLLMAGGGSASRQFTRSGVTYSLTVTMHPTDGGPTADNLTLLAQFIGFSPQNGSLNFIVRVSMGATAGPAYPYYSKNETHFVHLPALVDPSQRSFCPSVLGDPTCQT